MSLDFFNLKSLPSCFLPSNLSLNFSFHLHNFISGLFKRVHVQSIPVGFAKQHIQENKGMATLRFSGKSWPVKLLIYTQTRKRRKLLCFTRETRVFFSTGWPAFARDTHLHVGNICAFELINRDDAVFQVSIFPSAGKEPIHID